MAVPKRRKSKNKACIRLNFLKYKKDVMFKKIKLLTLNKTKKNIINFFKKQKYYII